MLVGKPLDIRSQKTVGQIILRAGIGRDHHELTPLASSVTGLLPQFPSGRLQGRFVLLAHTRTKFIGGHAQPMPVLTDHHKRSFPRDGDRIHPIGIFQYVILRHPVAIGQLKTLSAHSEPGTPEYILTGKHLPTRLIPSGNVGRFYHLLLFHHRHHCSRQDRSRRKIISQKSSHPTGIPPRRAGRSETGHSGCPRRYCGTWPDRIRCRSWC